MITEKQRTLPIEVPQSVRQVDVRNLTSCWAGKIVPICVEPILREDRIANGRFRVSLKAMEMAETIINPINVRVSAYYLPAIMCERFGGDVARYNRAYIGSPDRAGDPTVIPLYETMPFVAGMEIFETLGVHEQNLAQINSEYVELYNELVSYMYRGRSRHLTERLKTDTSLATCFWQNDAMSYIVPDYDAAMLDGEIDLVFEAQQLPVKGFGVLDAVAPSTSSGNVAETDGTVRQYTRYFTDNNSASHLRFEAEQIEGNWLPRLFAEMQQEGVKLSLSNLELAKETRAWAAMRKTYSGLDEEYLVDLLMQGIRVPDAELNRPILLDRKTTMFGMNQRYATDAANLNKHVTEGETVVDLSINTPKLNVGGVMMIVAEIVPEQLYERQQDVYLSATSSSDLPTVDRDMLDPHKVEVVQNKFVDALHSDPDGAFGYAPLNHAWRHRNIPRIGGKFMRDDSVEFDENRQRIWANEVIDPQLTEDFYLASTLHHNVFGDFLSPPFEIRTLGQMDIIGNTVFGKTLDENTGDYAEVIDRVDTSIPDQGA